MPQTPKTGVLSAGISIRPVPVCLKSHELTPYANNPADVDDWAKLLSLFQNGNCCKGHSMEWTYCEPKPYYVVHYDLHSDRVYGC